ncbi:MAG TPA: hypothetical protein VIV60_04560 [Polyangiaceae bacterium]
MAALRLILALSFIVELVTLGACDESDNASTSSTDPQSDLTQEDFVTGYRDSSCKILQGCCKTLSLGYDADQCQAWFANAGQGSASAVFNPSAGAQCLDQMAGLINCGHTNNAPACAEVYSGMLQPGEVCTRDTDCAAPHGGIATCDPLRQICIVGTRGQLYDYCQQSCEQFSNGSTACVWGPASGSADGTAVVNCYANDGLTCGYSGQCSALAKLGETCVDDSSCQRDLYCSYSGAATCQPRRTIGQSCAEFSTPCVAAAFCQAGNCAAKKANDQRCLSNAECLGVCNCGVSGDCSTEGSCADPEQLLGDWMFVVAASNFCGGPLNND